jgi:hypothetical protein
VGRLLLLSVFAFYLTQSGERPTCPDVKACRAAALEAAARQDYEAFHDLAWRAVQRGRPNDPESMYLVARAQSLSGRPGDALVMIRRLVQMGVATDAATNDDFRRVRALPGWADVEALISGIPAKPADVPTATAPARPEPSSIADAKPAPAKPAPRKPVEDSNRPRAADPTLEAETPRVTGAGAEDALRLTRILADPVGLAYDSVSRRFIVGDRKVNKLVVVDEVFNRITDMVAAASAGFFGLTAFEIDRRRGDLWVANSSAQDGASLHKLQLISGRVLYAVRLPTEIGGADFHDLAITPGGTVLVLDRSGKRVFRLPAASRAFDPPIKLTVDEPVSLAVADEHTAYVAGRKNVVRVQVPAGTTSDVQGSRGMRLDGLTRIWWVNGSLVGLQAQKGGAMRIVRIRLDPRGTRAVRVEVLDADAAVVNPTMAGIGEGELYYVTEQRDAHVVRRVSVR